jgi:Uma2 family endonuclease
VLNIPEYWVVDNQQKTVTVFELVDQLYEAREYREGETIISSIFPTRNFQVEQILNAA